MDDTPLYPPEVFLYALTLVPSLPRSFLLDQPIVGWSNVAMQFWPAAHTPSQRTYTAGLHGGGELRPVPASAANPSYIHAPHFCTIRMIADGQPSSFAMIAKSVTTGAHAQRHLTNYDARRR